MVNGVLWIFFLTAFAVQLIYILFIFSRLALFKAKQAKEITEPKAEGVTVVIAAHNEKDNLKKLIPILCNQDYPNFDIMVINDRSFDGTRSLLEKMMARYPQIRTVTVKYTPDHVTSKKYALTLGIKVAKHDVLLLTDADCIPASDQWIRQMTAPVREQGKTFALGFSPYEHDRGFLNKWIQFETLWTAILYFSFALWKAPFMGVGRNLCYRRSFFMEKKAFKDLWQITCGDDDLFINKYATGKNTALVISPDSITVSKPKSTWKQFFIQKKRHFYAGKFYRARDKNKIGLYTFTHLLFWIVGICLMIFLAIEGKWEQFASILGIITVRSMMLTWIFTAARRNLQGIRKVFWPIFYDFIYLGYFWIIGSIGYRSKTVRWK
ncbi:glycosyltransferase [Belliella kenyensis]|uniref:Glycosyltransferase n=1 Tax=Belliella kenyensis TaxID=1472724 RepID=A0ABV8EIU3_9BACT|nr:glycosyltransferase [Belliella kenyensis]MCH7402740.1 glycosyltransferase [Belliella kenyensis]MDN3603712.1 glycosyltransferase [Belliella kenyensis]